MLLIGFGRFGQIVSQVLLSRGWSVSIIDTDTEMITVAGYMGMKVYFGDGARLDILHAAGAAEARAILICIDNPEAATRIAEIAKAEFPLVPVLARAYRPRARPGAGPRRRGLPAPRDLRDRALTFGGRALDDLGEDAGGRRARCWTRSATATPTASPRRWRATSPRAGPPALEPPRGAARGRPRRRPSPRRRPARHGHGNAAELRRRQPPRKSRLPISTPLWRRML